METYSCWHHEIHFEDKKQYDYHMRRECEGMLKRPNTCTFRLSSGKCCRKSFRHTASLVIHSLQEHEVQICDKCYKTCAKGGNTILEKHRHKEGLNLRLSELKNKKNF